MSKKHDHNPARANSRAKGQAKQEGARFSVSTTGVKDSAQARYDAVTARLEQLWRLHQAELRDIEVDVPEEYRFGTYPDQVFHGQCFWQAYLYTAMNYPLPGILYVYGDAVLGAGLHAWVELPGDVVFDATLQRFYQRAAYYERQIARPFYKYTAEAARVIFSELHQRLDAMRWNWNVYLGLPWSDPGSPPLIIDLKEAERRMATCPRFPKPRAKTPKPSRRRRAGT